jgi:PAS domain S-box-containing protein
MKSRLLVIDDEESIRFTFVNFLTSEGYDVATADNYDDALNLISSREFDLIFADIILGGKTGIDLLQEINRKGLRTPVIMVTGYPNVETASDAVRLGAFDYISKPVRQDTLIHTTNLALQHKTLQDENEKYRVNLEAIFRSVKDAIITVDKEMKIMDANEAARNVCGIGREAVGRKMSELDFKCTNKCVELLKKTIESKQSVELYRVECEFEDNVKKVVAINASPLLDRTGQITGTVLVVRDETRLNDLERSLRKRHKFHYIIGKSDQMQKIYSLIEDLADVKSTVLITGESGTGKELVAEAVHYRGNRGNKPMVTVNCSALSESLLESELFGHVKGAFTGAERDRIGRFQRAEGGTIFLDEIGDISPRMQLRLLRVIQEKEFERVGDSTPIKADVRIIAATNQDLAKKVKTGAFRKDLYYRLRVVGISLPTLRERREDIPLLVDYFINVFNGQFNKKITSVSDNVQKIFMDYPWPGNVRELEHVIEHAFVTSHQETITVDQLPPELHDFMKDEHVSSREDSTLDRQDLLDALQKAGWNKSKAARILNINVRTIYRKMDKFDIKEERH